MKTIFKSVLAVAVAAMLGGCGNGGHFLTDKAYREKVHGDFLARQELAVGRSEQLFSVFEKEGLTTEQREALEFLYAYMPLCDLSEYDGEYFLRQVDGAFRAREFFHWGKSVPEEIFRHFVLVHRVNNEYMDDARDAFFEELKDRIKDMSMYDAALEVNHWCHEKVTYRGTDARTSAPLALVKTSWGRCGEESTFTTTALRAVGIPARQCYTPRWVHTDSNHAWVEVWIDGKWYYLGACEPEPEMNVAWFDGPVQRAMMTHTTVYGAYDGPEEKNVETPLYSVINTLSNYAKTRVAAVRVVDADGQPVEGARVQFKVYNYAELYPIVTVQSDAEGRAAINTGFGDLMVWADKDGVYGYAKSEPGSGEVTVALVARPGKEWRESYVMAAPPEQPFNELAPEKIAANAVRLAYEDSLRNAYMATFPDEAYAQRVAAETGLDGAEVWRYLHAAQGNWREIEAFIRQYGQRALAMLATLRDKDIRDTPAEYLSGHLKGHEGERTMITSASIPEKDVDDILWKEVNSPRIGYELITPLWDFFPGGGNAPETPDRIVAHVKQSVTISDWENYYNCRQTPMGVHTLKVADSESRDIYFVAMCRALGFPARLDPAIGIPQYRSLTDGQWVNVDFDAAGYSGVVPPKGTLVLSNDAANIVKPGYGTHFSVAVYQDGDFRTLNIGSYFAGDAAQLDADLGGYGGKSFPVTIPLDEGYYRLMAASRANDGSATVEATYFTVAKGQTVRQTVKLPEVEGRLFVKGVVDMNSIVVPDSGEKTTLKKLGGGKGVMLVFADPDKEPTKHILQELPAHKRALEEWGGGVVFMVPDDKRTEAFDPGRFPGQPAQTVWATDAGRELLGQAAGAIQVAFRNNFPLVVYLTNNGGVIFSSEGYRIGIIEDVLKTIRLEELTKQ